MASVVVNNHDHDLVFEAVHRDGKIARFAGHIDVDGVTAKDIVRMTLGADAQAQLPPMLHELSVLELGGELSYQKGFDVICVVEIAFQGKPTRMALEFAKSGDSFKFAGTMLLAAGARDLNLSIHFDTDKTSKRFLATLNHIALDMKSIVSLISDEMAQVVPDDIIFEMDDLVFAYEATDGPNKALIGASFDLGGALSLTELPIVGEMLPADFGINGAQILANTAAMTKAELSKLDGLIPDGSKSRVSLPDIDLAPGAAMTAALKMGHEIRHLTAPFGTKPKGADPAKDALAPETDKHHIFGPLKIYKTGFALRDDRAWVMIDAAIIAAGITMSFKGLGIGIKLDDLKHPKAALDGIGLGYDRGGIKLNGALQRQKTKGMAEQFAGSAVIATQALTLSAIGAYSKEKGHDPSLFLYAVLDQPLGGPAFFFVKGLAAGFGYNRRLTAPTVDQIEQFPLIQAAIKPAGSGGGPSDMLGQLNTYLPAAPGENFAAVGVRFTTFELIETFALLTLGFGKSFDATLLGISTLEIPPMCPTTPLARVRIGLVAHVDDGALEIDGKILDGSYVFSEDCHLSGGFAFYSWFTGPHTGDFVMTVGGYHPDFKPPAHYPTPSRLALNWAVSPELSVKGSCYFALTSLGMMAGGHLSAVWRSGAFSACFKADADFLVVWEPYHYQADISVSISARYTFSTDLLVKKVSKTLSVDVGAALHLHGPEFAGTAFVDLDIVSFTVRFGEDSPKVGRISWNSFAQKFLPKPEQTCTFTLKDGLIETRKGASGDVWVVNPKTFRLVAETTVPATLATFQKTTVDSKASGFATPAIRPVATKDFSSNLKLSVTGDPSSKFHANPITKSVPAALWGAPTSHKPGPNDVRLLKDALCGFELRPAHLKPPAVIADVSIQHLKMDVQPFAEPLQAGTFTVADVGSGKGKARGVISPALLASFTATDERAL